jgi:hypothetical protein|tara:strand:- start:1760 stop:1972 length:213 start_codon:yes stop_codon:yes gene_type:complete
MTLTSEVDYSLISGGTELGDLRNLGDFCGSDRDQNISIILADSPHLAGNVVNYLRENGIKESKLRRYRIG